MTMTQPSYMLSADQLGQFDEQGYIILRNIVPPEALAAVQEVFESVVERLASTWYDEGLITETHADLPSRSASLHCGRSFPHAFRRAGARRC